MVAKIMKIEIIETKEVRKKIDVDLPYYYEHDLSFNYDDCRIFGEITKDQHFSIQINKLYDGTESVEINLKKHNNFLALSDYFNTSEPGTSQISKEDFIRVQKEAMKILNHNKSLINS